jgi:hypothetical protein
MSKQFVTTLGAVVTGVVAGALLVTGVRSKLATASVAKPAAKEVVAAPSTAPAGPDLRALQARLARLEAQGARGEHATPDDSAAAIAAPPSPPSQSAEEARAEWARHEADRKAQVAAEPVDRDWSRGASAAFRKDFEALGAKAGFTLTDVQCKTTSCLARVRWDSYAKAGEGWRDVLHARYAQNCAREVFVLPPSDDRAGAPYEATAFFDCAASRTDPERSTVSAD